MCSRCEEGFSVLKIGSKELTGMGAGKYERAKENYQKRVIYRLDIKRGKASGKDYQNQRIDLSHLE